MYTYIYIYIYLFIHAYILNIFICLNTKMICEHEHVFHSRACMWIHTHRFVGVVKKNADGRKEPRSLLRKHVPSCERNDFLKSRNTETWILIEKKKWLKKKKICCVRIFVIFMKKKLKNDTKTIMNVLFSLFFTTLNTVQ